MRRRVTFAYTTATRRAARNARAEAYVRTTESDRHAKSAKVEEFASTTDTEQAAKSVAEVASVHTVESDASARNAAAAKSASMAAKGALCGVLGQKCFSRAIGMAAGRVKAQVFVSTASGSINQRASCAAKLRVKQLQASIRTAQENRPNNPSANNSDGNILFANFDRHGDELLAHEVIEDKRNATLELRLF